MNLKGKIESLKIAIEEKYGQSFADLTEAIQYALDNGGGGGNVFEPFKFINIGDPHYQYSQDMTTTFTNSVNALSGIDFVTCVGDLTLELNGDRATKEQEFSDVKMNLIDRLNIPLYTCVGNHDYSSAFSGFEELWSQYVGGDTTRVIKHKDCVFLFTDPWGGHWLDWLIEQCAKYASKRVYIFEHYQFESDEFTVGLKEGEHRYTWSDADLKKALSILRNNPNVIWFTGHTHNAFGVSVNDTYHGSDVMGTVVHTPFLKQNQAWEINVGDNSTVLKQIRFTGSGIEYLGTNVTVVQKAVVGESEIVLASDGGVVGKMVEINVHLASAPKNTQTVVLSCDGVNITGSDKTLVFDAEDYDTDQSVTFTASAIGTGKITARSDSKITVLKTTISDQPVINWFNKDKPLTDLGISYGGSAPSANYQQSNYIPARTGDTVKVNTLGSSAANMLRLYDKDFNYIGSACSNVSSINYTITEANVEYVSFMFRGATAGLVDTIMCMVNQDIPPSYVGYNGDLIGLAITNYADASQPSVVDGYYNSSFVQMSASGLNVTNLIPVSEGDLVYTNAKGNVSNGYMYLYDSDRNVKYRGSISRPITVPSGYSYISIGYQSSVKIQVMKNQTNVGWDIVGTEVL